MTTASVDQKPHAAVPEKVQVELDIFSGRPNPTWNLSGADAVAWSERTAAASSADARTLSAPLGYRGFVVQAMQAGRAVQWRVQRGVLEVSRDGIVTYHHDRNRGLERWLLDTGTHSLGAEMVSLVEQEWDR